MSNNLAMLDSRLRASQVSKSVRLKDILRYTQEYSIKGLKLIKVDFLFTLSKATFPCLLKLLSDKTSLNSIRLLLK